MRQTGPVNQTGPVFTVVGEALVDLVEAAAGPGPGETGIGETGPAMFTAHAGGSPYNVAITLARLGIPVTLAARTGQDRFGRMLADKARASGVRFDAWQTVAEPTTLAVASLDAAGRASYDFYLDATAGLGWDAGLAGRLAPDGPLHTGSLASWRPPSAAVVQAVQRRAHDAGVLVSYDPNVRPALINDPRETAQEIEQCVAAAHLVKASDEDLAYLYPSRPPAEVAKAWCALGATLVVVTLGADGAVVYGTDGELARVPGERVVVADTVGAGDAFAGGLLAALADAGLATPAGLRAATAAEIAAAVRMAVLVAGITCERQGADPPGRAELTARR